ncbi:MAG: hypothetical protein ACJAVK_000540, partial [Akkermansiaceae bacterium]
MTYSFRWLLLSCAVNFLASVAHADLVAHWPLDGNAEDALGNHHGSASSVVFGADGAAAHTGTAAEFNGSNATITVPHDAELNPTSFTLSMWVNADSIAGFASPVTSRDDVAATSVHGYLVYNDNGGNWNFWTGTGGGAGAWNTLAGDAVETGAWTHLAVSYDSGSQTKRLYVNGVLAASNSSGNLYSPNGPQSENFHIGSGADNGTSFYFDGLIDEVALWDEALTSAEVQDVMDKGVPGGPPAVTSFLASPPFIDSGQSVTLSWETINATTVSISPGIGNVPAASGTVLVSPAATTTYILTATGDSSPATTSQITVGVDVEPFAPIITEFLADNETSMIDPDGDFSDWLEILNPNPFVIDLGGWHLTDDPLDPEKYVIPPQQIPAGGFVVLFASGKPGAIDFKLSKEGGYLALGNPEGTIVQEFSPRYPAQFDDVSYGRSFEGTLTYLIPTPGTANGPPRREIGPAINVSLQRFRRLLMTRVK